MKRGVFVVLILLILSIAASAQYYDVSYSAQGMVGITGGVAVDSQGRTIPGAPSITGMVTTPSEKCTETFLPGYKQYGDPAIAKVWDGYSADTDAVCRYDYPDMPDTDACVHTVELTEPTTGRSIYLCWYHQQKGPGVASTTSSARLDIHDDRLDEFAPEPSPVQEQQTGFFAWLKRLFGAGPAPIHPLNLEQATQAVRDQVLAGSDLPQDTLALIWPKPLPANTIVSDGMWIDVQIPSPAYLAWIDPFPDMMYGHPTIYALVLSDGSVDVSQGVGWAEVDGADIREVGEPITGAGAPAAPTGAAVSSFSSVTGMQTLTTSRPPVKLKHRSIVEIKPPTSAAKTQAAEECPPGYNRVEKPAEGKEEGLSLTVVGRDHPRPSGVSIDFEGEATRFAQATAAAKFAQSGPVTTPSAFEAALQNAADKLGPPSSFALFISSHGLDLWKTTMRDRRTGRQVQIDYFPGEPSPDRFGLHGGSWELVSKSRNGWCFGLGGKCVQFDPDTHLAPIQSCRKFLASNACFGGTFTQHSVKGLSAYAGSDANSPGRTFPTQVRANGRVPSIFGYLFTNALAQNPPLDPTQPQKDEPKPEFDAAFAATSGVKEGNTATLHLSGGRTLTFTFHQTPVSHSVPGDKDCQKQITCEPTGGLPPPKEGENCEKAFGDAVRIPGTLEQMMQQGNSYPYDQLESLSSMIRTLEILKTCGKCPADQTAVWEGCSPNKNTLLSQMITLLRAYGSSGFKSDQALLTQLKALVSELQKCKLKCYPHSILDELSTNGLLPSPTPSEPLHTCPRSDYFDRTSCARACRNVGGECVEQDRCWKCVTSGSTPQTQDAISTGGSTTTTPRSCQDICGSKGMVTSMPDWSSYILNYLNSNGVCKKSASISFGNYLRSGDCTCYPSSPPSVTVSGTLACENTPCGTVACNSEATCACPDQANCEYHVSCSWGGWKQIGAQAFQPTIRTAST